MTQTRAPSLWLLIGFVLGPAASGLSISFRNDVEPVISKAGCNAGTCHGNKFGKGGFKLSLRGQGPGFDLLALTRDGSARRTDSFDPEESLVLLKATTQVPHEGGLRFKKNSEEYEILRRWIADGAADDLPGNPTLTKLEAAPEEKVDRKSVV